MKQHDSKGYPSRPFVYVISLTKPKHSIVITDETSKSARTFYSHQLNNHTTMFAKSALSAVRMRIYLCARDANKSSLPARHFAHVATLSSLPDSPPSKSPSSRLRLELRSTRPSVQLL